MLISKKTEYALKALCHLAQQPDNSSILIADLARANNIPKKFLEFILLSLRKGGVLKSRIGKGGGYRLSQKPSEVTIGSIINILEGDVTEVQCMNDAGKNQCLESNNQSCCGIHLVMNEVKQSIAAVLETATLADMIEKIDHESRRRSGVIDYSI